MKIIVAAMLPNAKRNNFLVFIILLFIIYYFLLFACEAKRNPVSMHRDGIAICLLLIAYCQVPVRSRKPDTFLFYLCLCTSRDKYKFQSSNYLLSILSHNDLR